MSVDVSVGLILMAHLKLELPAGSTVVYPYNDTTLSPVELGASIFVEANKNMWRATDEFGLDRLAFADDDDPLGFWDGKEFVFVVSQDSQRIPNSV